MPTSLSSRERMLAALTCQPPDHTPCSFMLFRGLHDQCRDHMDFLERQMALGLDTFVELPPRPPRLSNDIVNLHGLPVSFDRRVMVEEWIRLISADGWPTIVKEYQTPAGTLTAEVKQTRDWRWGEHIPLFDDYVIPRSRKFLVAGERDLDALRYLLVPPNDAEISEFRAGSQPYIQFARQNNLLLAGGWGAGADVVGWLCGLFNMIILTHRQPEFMADLLNLIAAWNSSRMEVVLSAGIDLYIKRAWYENCDFWTPAQWKRFIQPILAEDVRLAHQAGAKFGYILTSSAMHLIEPVIDAGVDVLIGVDPREYDLQKTAGLADGRLCLWGGLNGYLTVEGGTPAAVRQEVEMTLDIMAGKPGFILSPVDNVREYPPGVAENVAALIDAWKSRQNG